MNFVKQGVSFIFALTLLTGCTASAQTLYLIGGALKTCSSMSQSQCKENTLFGTHAKTQNVYQINDTFIADINTFWPSNNNKRKLETRKLLRILRSEQLISKRQLIDKFKQSNRALYRAWSDLEYRFVIDMLEVPLVVQGKRAHELVNTQQNKVLESSEILADIEKKLADNGNNTLYLITASSKDPYESADFYQGLFSAYDIDAKWLPLTPALAKAMTMQDCQRLDKYRQQINGIFKREQVYPDLIKQEQTLCVKGAKYLKSMISSAGAVMFNGGDQSLTKQVMFDGVTGSVYPWKEALAEVPVIIGTSAGTAVQSGNGVPMITNGSSYNAIEYGAIAAAAPGETCLQNNSCGKHPADQLTFDTQGGLGSFSLATLDTHFSERGRSIRLAELAYSTKQTFAFGVDETTALKVQGERYQVIGKHGVVVVQPLEKGRFFYHFYPSGTALSLADFKPVKSMPNLDKTAPVMSVKNAIYNGDIRKVTQQICQGKAEHIESNEAKISKKVHFLKTSLTVCSKGDENYQQINRLLILY